MKDHPLLAAYDQAQHDALHASPAKITYEFLLGEAQTARDKVVDALLASYRPDGVGGEDVREELLTIMRDSMDGVRGSEDGTEYIVISGHEEAADAILARLPALVGGREIHSSLPPIALHETAEMPPPGHEMRPMYNGSTGEYIGHAALPVQQASMGGSEHLKSGQVTEDDLAAIIRKHVWRDDDIYAGDSVRGVRECAAEILSALTTKGTGR